MDKKVTKTPGGVSRKKGADIVSTAAYGAVASATGSGGAPTSLKKRTAKLKTQVRRSARDGVAAIVTPADLTTKVNLETLKKMIGTEKMEYEQERQQQTTKVNLETLKRIKSTEKMEFEEGQQQQTTVTPLEEITSLPTTSSEIPPVSSLDADNEEEVLPHSKAILLDAMSSPASGSGKRKKQAKTLSQIAAAEVKKKALKHARKTAVAKPPLLLPAVPHLAGLLEDPLPEKIVCEEKDVFKDIAASIVSKEKVEEQLLESEKKFQVLLSESEAVKRREEELLTELKELKKAAEISATLKKNLEQEIETSKAELEQTKLASSDELQRIRSEVEEKNKNMRETEMRNIALTKMMEETENRTAKTIFNKQEEINRLLHDLETAKELRKTAEISAALNTNLEQGIETSKAELEQTKLASSIELQKIRSEAEEKNKNMREIEMRNEALIRMMEETENRAAETISNKQEEINRLLHDLETAKAEELSLLRRENESQQTEIRQLKDEFSKNIQERERKIDFLEKEFLVNKSRVDAEAAEKVFRLEAAEAKNKHLEKQLIELRLAEEEYKKSVNTLTSSSEIKMKELQSQLELQKQKENQLRERIEVNNKEIREIFTREKEDLRKELQETAENKIVEARKESDRFRAMAKKHAEDLERERITVEKKNNELQEIQRLATEESERLNREKRNLIARVEDAERQQEKLEKEKTETMTVERYETDPAITESQFYKDAVSEVADGAAGVIENKILKQNQLLVEDVARSINDLKSTNSLSNEHLVKQQETHLEGAVKKITELFWNFIKRSDEIQESASNMIELISNDTATKQTEISTSIKRLEDRIVDEMQHDDSSDTDKMRLAWNLMKQSLIKKINSIYMEINNLRMTVKKSIVICNKEYLEFAEKFAEGTFLLLESNREIKNALTELSIGVTFYNEYGEIASSDVASIDPDVFKVEVKSLGSSWLEKDIKTIKMEMEMASGVYREIETMLLEIRKIADHLANFERQSLQEIETTKIVANLDGLTASKLYQELRKFHLFASTVENDEQFKKVLSQHQPLFKIFKDAILFLESKKDNKFIMEFLRRKGYSIGEFMANSIDAFFFKIMDAETKEISIREGMDDNVFISIMINTLDFLSTVIQSINNKIEDESKQKKIRANQMEYLKEHLLEEKNSFIELIQRELKLNQKSIAMELKEAPEEEGAVALPFPSTTPFTEMHSQDISILIDSTIRETKAAYRDSLDRLEDQYKIKEAKQLEEFQKQLQVQKERHHHEKENMRQLHQVLEEQIHRERQITNMIQETFPSPLPLPPPPSSSISSEKPVGPLGKTNIEDMEVDSHTENEAARQKKETKEQLVNALTAAAKTASDEEKAAKGYQSCDRNIKMFLKPDQGDFVEVDLSSKDSFPRQIKTSGLKKALSNTSKASNNVSRASSTSKNKNTLTGNIFLDTIKEKVFPYSSESALKDNGEDGGPALLHHPEFFRHAFIRDATSFSEQLTVAEKSESVRNFTRLLEYSLFNNTARGTRSDNDMLSRLIYVVFEHDAKMVRYISDIIYKFREYATGRGEDRDSRSNSIILNENRGNLLEAIIATVFSAVLPIVSSMVSRVAEAVTKPIHNDVRIRSTYSLLSLIEKFIFCASKRVHILKNVLEKSGLVNKLSFYAADANADETMSYDVQYDYSLLRMMLELMTINITNLVDTGIKPLKAAVLSLGTFTDVEKTEETDRALIPTDSSVLAKACARDIDVPKTISVINYLSAVTDWYVVKRYSNDDTDKESLNKAVELMYILLTNNFGTSFKIVTDFKTELENATPSTIFKYISEKVLPELNATIENVVKETESNDAILVKGASEVGSLGQAAANMSLGMSKNNLALPWLEVDFRGGVDDSTLLWVLSGGAHSDEVVRDYQLSAPLYFPSPRKKSAAPLRVKPLVRVINNTSGSDNVFLNNNRKTTREKEEGSGGGDYLHIVSLAKNVSCAVEYSTKDRYEVIINKMYRDGLVLVKGDAEVPRVFPMQDGKWMDNTRDNRTFTPLSVSRWKMPSASLVYGMLSKKNKDEWQNKKGEEKTTALPVIEFMGGKAGNVFLEMLTLPSEQPIISTTDSFTDTSSTDKGLWKTSNDEYTSLDAERMMTRLISGNKRARTGSPSSVAMVPYRDATDIVVNDHLEVNNSNSSWWIRGIQPNMRRDAAALSAVQEHLYFVLTPIF